MRGVVLDTGPLGMIVHPGGPPQVEACQLWLNDLLAQSVRVILPEIADYELRRELTRLRKASSLLQLDVFADTLEYLPITTAVMRLAAQFWAQARQQGLSTADPKELDGDVILAAQAATLGVSNIVIATTNVGHLAPFVSAKLWHEI